MALRLQSTSVRPYVAVICGMWMQITFSAQISEDWKKLLMLNAFRVGEFIKALYNAGYLDQALQYTLKSTCIGLSLFLAIYILYIYLQREIHVVVVGLQSTSRCDVLTTSKEQRDYYMLIHSFLNWTSGFVCRVSDSRGGSVTNKPRPL